MLITLFLRSPFSKVEEIHVSGNHLLSSEKILKQINFYEGMSFFLISEVNAEDRLKHLPEVDKVHIRKIFPKKVYVDIQEKPVIAMIETRNNRFLPILSDGFILENLVDKQFYTAPIFKGWEIPNQTFTLAVRNLSRLPKTILDEIKIINPIENHEDQIKILSKRGHQIFVKATDLDKKMKYYPSFYTRPPGKLYLLESIWFIPEERKQKNHSGV